MSNRAGSFLSDENMRKICFEGRPVPMNRLDLMLPPQMNTSPVYVKPTGTNPRMERPSSVDTQIATLARASGVPKSTLFELYRKTLENKKDVKMNFSKAKLEGRVPGRYIPDITDEIMRILLEAQVFSGDLVPQPPEGPRPEPTFLTETRLLTDPMSSDSELPSETELNFPPRFNQFYPPAGLESDFEFQTRPFNVAQETARRIKEAEQGRPAYAQLTGAPGRPRPFQLGNIGDSSEPINMRQDPDVVKVN